MAEEELGPLPTGRHGLSREQVAYSQRERIIAAFAQAVAEHGYNDVTLAHIAAGASVSRRAFYQNFASKQECFLATFDAVIDHLRALIEAALEPLPDWPHRTIAALRTSLDFFASEPTLAHLCLLDSLSADPPIAAHYSDTLQSFAYLLAPGRDAYTGTRELPPTLEVTIFGALASKMARLVSASQAERLPELLPDFVEFALGPYLGHEQAARLAREAAA